jgi:hypothetical protein
VLAGRLDGATRGTDHVLDLQVLDADPKPLMPPSLAPRRPANTLTITTDKQGKERRILPGIKTGVSTPNIR